MIRQGAQVRAIAGMTLLAVLGLSAPSFGAPPPGAVARPAAAGLPRLPAPLGLVFGMRPEEVTLPVVVAPAVFARAAGARPAPATAAAPPQATPRSGPVEAPTRLFSPGSRTSDVAARALPPGPARPAPVLLPRRGPLEGTGEYLRACEAAFDSVSALAGGDRDWLAWRSHHLRGGEGIDFSADIADRAGLAVAPAALLASEAEGWRSAGLYRFDSSDTRRVVCLLFTGDGLAQVFLAGHALDGLRDGIVAGLEERPRLASFSVVREARRFSLSLQRPACGLFCRLFGERMLVERRLWLDPGSRILVAAKRGLLVSGLSAAFSGEGSRSEVFDGLPESFVASIDLSRRAFVRQPPAAGHVTSPAGVPRAAPAFAPAPAGPAPRLLIDSFMP